MDPAHGTITPRTDAQCEALIMILQDAQVSCVGFETTITLHTMSSVSYTRPRPITLDSIV